jgi:protein-tyrosine phosphatase
MADRSRRLLDGAVRVKSAGLRVGAGYYPAAETLAIAKERGVDGETLRSVQLADDMLEAADLVVTMTADHATDVLELAPGAAEKTFTLKELAALVAALPPTEASTDREGVLERIAEAHRLRTESPGVHPPDDVRDPLGMPPDAYREVAAEIEDAVDELVRGLFGVRERAEASPGGS